MAQELKTAVIILATTLCISGQSCDLTLNAGETVAEKSPDVGSFSSIFCDWTITASEADRIVTVTFRNISLDIIADCNTTSGLVIHDKDLSGDILGLTCENEIAQFQSSGSSMVIRFPSSLVATEIRFIMQYRDLPATSCGTYVIAVANSKSDYYTIMAPGYPTPSSAPLQCSWTVLPITKERIRVKIDITGDPSTTCEHANITILGEGGDSTVWCPGGSNYHQSWEGFTVFQVHLSPGRNIKIQYLAIEESTCKGKLTASNKDQTISTPNFPGAFPSFTECRWVIESPNWHEGGIQLDLTSSDVEESEGCKDDVFKIVSRRHLLSNDLSPAIVTTCNNQAPLTFYVYQKYAVVVFSSLKETNTRKGISLKYRYGSVEPCGGTLIARNTSQQIQSPGYPFAQSQSAACTWTITAEDPDSTVEVEFIDIGMKFNLEHCRSALGFVAFFEGSNINASMVSSWRGSHLDWADKSQSVGDYLLEKVCGNTSKIIRGFKQSMTIVYITEWPSFGEGFLLAYKQAAVNFAGRREFTETDGPYTFASPRYPIGKVKNAAVQWTIKSMLNYFELGLSFFEVDLGHQSNCSNNYVKVYKGNETTDAYVSTICGTDTGSFISSTGFFTIVFQTDSTLATKGFKAEYQSSTNYGCNGDPTSLTALSIDRVFTLPSFRNLYPNMVKCQYIVDTSKSFFIRITIDEIDVPDCDGDSLEIFDGPTDAAPVLLKTCGSNPRTVESTNSKVLLRFISDRTVAGKGFTITYRSVYRDSIYTTGIIVGVVVGVLALLALAVVGYLFYRYKTGQPRVTANTMKYSVK